LAWYEGLDEWVNVKEMLEDDAPSLEAEDEPAPEAEEPSVETESDEESEPLDEETLSQVNKIKGLISDGHADIAWQLVRTLNNPRIYEGLLEDCPVNDDGWVSVPEYLSENVDLFIKLQTNLPEAAQMPPELTQLTKLSLPHTPYMIDVSPLKELTQLRYLKIVNDRISDVSPLKYLKQLTELRLVAIQISDISTLKELTQLEVLYLWDNQISDVTPLKELTQLKHLELGGNEISDVSVLKELTQLTRLNLDDNQLTDVTALKDLTQLTTLWLSGNQLTELPTGLEKLTKLEYLNLNENPDLTKAQINELKKSLPKCKIHSNAKK
jgi:hypothetical protein